MRPGSSAASSDVRERPSTAGSWRRWPVRCTALAGAASLVLAGCLPGEGEEESSGPSSAPLTTTSTDSSSSSSSSASGGGEQTCEARQPTDLLTQAKDYMSASQNVTIEVDGSNEETGDYTLRAAGASEDKKNGSWRVLLEQDEGGTLEMRKVGWTRFVKADEAYLEGTEKDNPLREHADEWVKFGWDADSESLDSLSPATLVDLNFFGESLDAWDVDGSGVRCTELRGRAALQMDAAAGRGGGSGSRVLWIAQGAEPQMLQLAFTKGEQSTTMRFSDWNETDVSRWGAPAGARSLKEDEAGDIEM